MKWKFVPVLGAVCATVLAGCCHLTEYHVPGISENRKTEEAETLFTEPSDPKAPSVNQAVKSDPDEESLSMPSRTSDIQPAWHAEETDQQSELRLQTDPEQPVQDQVGEVNAPSVQPVQGRSGAAGGSSGLHASRRIGERNGSSGRSVQSQTGEANGFPEQSSQGQFGGAGGSSGQSSESGEISPGNGSGGEGPSRPDSPIRFGSIQKTFSPWDIPPADTVKYTASRKEEITETRYVQSVVDPDDPSTYKVVEKKEEVPILYVNQAGDIKYAFEDGKWYEYRYCSGTVMLDEKDQDTALKLLNYRGDYNDYEVLYVNCKESDEGNQALRYQFQIRYRGRFAMEKAPTELNRFTCVDLGTVAATMTRSRAELVPVLVEQTFGTGEYRYYGWQELDGKTFYYDENGERVTGQQIIQGIRHIFDEQGVRISRAGVEVSEENGVIDWEKAAECRIDTAMIRCAYRASDTGMLIPDAQAERNLLGAGQAGIEAGITLLSQAVTADEAVEEAEYLIRLADEYKITGPIAITVSWANPEHNGRADMLGREERTKYIAACGRRLREAGYTPMLHTDETFLSDGLVMDELTDFQLWLTACDPDLTYTGSCEIWQYTDRGTADGMSGYAGLYISYGK